MEVEYTRETRLSEALWVDPAMACTRSSAMDYSSLLNSFMEFLNVKEWVLTLVPYLLLFFFPFFCFLSFVWCFILCLICYHLLYQYHQKQYLIFKWETEREWIWMSGCKGMWGKLGEVQGMEIIIKIQTTGLLHVHSLLQFTFCGEGDRKARGQIGRREKGYICLPRGKSSCVEWVDCFCQAPLESKRKSNKMGQGKTARLTSQVALSNGGCLKGCA